MPNNRIFYACQAVALAKSGHSSGDEFRIMHGVQSVGINTNFTLEQAFELGQVELYANEEEIAEIEVTIEKLIDGKPLLYLQAVGNIGKTDVVGASNSRTDVYLGVYPDSNSAIAGKTVSNVVMCSGMYVSSLSYTYPVDGFATESLTLVGNDKFWNNGFGLVGAGGGGANAVKTLFNTDSGEDDTFDGTDLADNNSGSGVIRRAKVDITNSIIPPEVCSQDHVGPGSGIQTITINADFGRENQLELGRFGPYNRYATFPFEVTAEFEVNATNGDLVSVSGANKNLTNRSIVIKDLAGTVINLGTKNKLTSVAYTGGDTGGGIATITYSYSTYNDLKVDGGGTYY